MYTPIRTTQNSLCSLSFLPSTTGTPSIDLFKVDRSTLEVEYPMMSSICMVMSVILIIVILVLVPVSKFASARVPSPTLLHLRITNPAEYAFETCILQTSSECTATSVPGCGARSDAFGIHAGDEVLPGVGVDKVFNAFFGFVKYLQAEGMWDGVGIVENGGWSGCGCDYPFVLAAGAKLGWV